MYFIIIILLLKTKLKKHMNCVWMILCKEIKERT